MNENKFIVRVEVIILIIVLCFIGGAICGYVTCADGWGMLCRSLG